ncbi:uncharacterized protein [Rutidosis leptorrhynchoides]|uniref:uncharacterized protein n=1 Tax=Rutidosis leptorrhynchoides TaxID=125765 RepID=UPI003A9A02F6
MGMFGFLVSFHEDEDDDLGFFQFFIFISVCCDSDDGAGGEPVEGVTKGVGSGGKSLAPINGGDAGEGTTRSGEYVVIVVCPKKVWSLVRVVYFMLRKNISKRKLLLDLNMMVKRGKIASKALQNLMFHHHHHHHNGSHESFVVPPPSEYEFSCTNSPCTNNHHHTFSLFPFHKKQHDNHSKENVDMMAVNVAVWKAMEMIHSETAPPLLQRFGKSPMVRQLRVTDSPFPLTNVDDDSHVVDEAAERFINRFYNDLRKENTSRTSFG